MKTSECKVNWKPDDVADRIVKDRKHRTLGWLWLNIDKIDASTSLRKNTRMNNGILEDANVDRFAEDMLAGHVFPGVVAMVCGPQTYELLGGITRMASCKKIGVPAVYALVVDNLSDQDAEYLRTVLNTKHGTPISPSALMEQAVRFCTEHGRRPKDVAGDLNIPLSSIQRACRIHEVHVATGHILSKGVPSDHVHALNKLAKLRDVQKEAASVLREVYASVSALEWSRWIDQTIRAGNEAAQIACITRLGASRAKTDKPKGAKATPRELFLAEWARFSSKVFRTDNLGILSADEAEEFATSWHDVAVKVARLIRDGAKRKA